MGVVAALHVGVIFLIARSLGIVPPLLTPPPIGLIEIDPTNVPNDPAPTVGPTLEDPTIHVPMPDDAAPEPNTDDTGISAKPTTGNPPVIAGPGTAIVEGLIVNASQDSRHPLTQPRYPSADTRLGNQGNVDVEVYVLPNGRVGDARVARSSGFERLDQSAIDEAKRNWRLSPATRDGVPFPQWYKVRVTFKLTDAR